MKKNLLRLAALAFATGTFLSSCNTTAGVGRDIQKLGGKMEDSAERTGGTE
ncbi:entericidin A/B family lipoprotein [Haloferula sp.]|uniref:entericidin A/B family lipoprotein n=1 Tax=Haloferula sp. TaxID=2497595 RepID=UPI0032A071EA